MSTLLAWHFLPDNACTRYSNEHVQVGTMLSASGDLELCENGLHASVHPRDAMKYAPGFLLCRVELSGEILEGEDKVCARHREVVAMCDAREIVLLHAAECAERALGYVKKPDPRSLAAVQAVRDFVSGKITRDQLHASRSDAWRARNAAAAASAASAAYASAASAAYAYAAYAASAASAAYADADAAAYAADAAYAASAADAAAAYAAAAASARKAFQQWDRETFQKRVETLFAGVSK